MIDLVFASPRLADLCARLRRDHLESAAVLLAVPTRIAEREGWRLLVNEIYVAPEEAYEVRTRTAVRLKPDFGLSIEKRARERRWSLVYCHSHPLQEGLPEFSRIDDEAEVGLAAYAEKRSQGVPHVSLLIGRSRAIARRLGQAESVRVIEVGEQLHVAYDPFDQVMPLELAHDRQIRAFGEDGQRRLHRIRVAIVGLGGTGLVVAQQLAHLGADDYLLIDPDAIDETNLNRAVGALPSDVEKTLKVDVAERVIRALRPNPRVETCDRDVTKKGVGRKLAGADLIFCCTDSHASRHLVNQVAYQYLVPAIDMGVAIDQKNDTPPAIWAHVKMLAPGLPCLWCAGHLDPRRVREELMSEAQHKTDPYFNQSGVIQPAVISITSTAASLAVTMFLSVVVGIPAASRYLVYDAASGRVRSMSSRQELGCAYCAGTEIGFGDAIPLPEHADA